MEGNKTKNITNCKQFERLVELMEKNLELARGFFTFGSSKAEYIESWNNFAKQLNSLGPPLREGAGWQKVWNDLKNKIKKKLGHNKKEISGTGGGSNKLFVFSPLEESVISILCLDKTCSASNKTFGLVKNIPPTTEPSTSNSENTTFEQLSTDPNTETEIVTPSTNQEPQPAENQLNTPVPPRVNRKRSLSNNCNEERRQLLQSQTKILQEQTKYLKECARYARKSYEMQEKKFKMWKEVQIEKRKSRQQNMEYKLKALEYKEKKLALQEKSQ